jgi:hypothetical protein
MQERKTTIQEDTLEGMTKSWLARLITTTASLRGTTMHRCFNVFGSTSPLAWWTASSGPGIGTSVAHLARREPAAGQARAVSVLAKNSSCYVSKLALKNKTKVLDPTERAERST